MAPVSAAMPCKEPIGEQRRVPTVPYRSPAQVSSVYVRPSTRVLALVFAQPVLDPKTADAGKFTFVIGYDGVT